MTAELVEKLTKTIGGEGVILFVVSSAWPLSSISAACGVVCAAKGATPIPTIKRTTANEKENASMLSWRVSPKVWQEAE